MFRKLLLAGALAFGLTAATAGTASAQVIVSGGYYGRPVYSVPVYSPPRVIVNTGYGWGGGWGSPVYGGGWGYPSYGWGGGYRGGWGYPSYGWGGGYPYYGGGWGRPSVGVGFNFIFR